MQKIVIYGAGMTGKIVFDFVDRSKVCCFADTYPDADSFLGKPLIGFNQLKDLYHNEEGITVIVASYDFYEDICRNLIRHGIMRYYVWPLIGNYPQQAYVEKYLLTKLLKDYEIEKYQDIALYSDEKELRTLQEVIYTNFNVNIKYTFTNETVDDFNAAKDNIDLLILNISRRNSKLHDTLETTKLPFDVADLMCFEKFTGFPNLKKFKDCHKGESCFIIGNGPSLKIKDLDVLHKNNIITFGANRIYLAFNESQWRPAYYVAMDEKGLLSTMREIHAMTGMHKFITDNAVSFWESPYSEGAIKFHEKIDDFYPAMPEFSADFSAYTVCGKTVTYTSMQIAAYMGFSEIYLLGVDFTFPPDKGVNNDYYFHKDYVRPDEIMSTHIKYQPHKVALAYKKAEIHSRLNGFRIYNATRGGDLEVFERVDFDSLF